MTDQTPRSIDDRARAAIQAEEKEKAFLMDRSGPPAPRPSKEYIEASLGKTRSPEELGQAIKDRAASYARNAQPAPDYIDFEEAKSRAQAIKSRQSSKDRDLTRDR